MIILLTVLGLASASEAHYEHYATWENVPKIITCGKKAPSIKEVNESLEYWRSLGYSFNTVITKKERCEDVTMMKGSIIVKNKYSSKRQGYTTTTKYAYSNNLKKQYVHHSIIEVNQEVVLYPSENKESLTHEIGHALGINHVNNVRDVMFPYAIQKYN